MPNTAAAMTTAPLAPISNVRRVIHWLETGFESASPRARVAARSAAVSARSVPDDSTEDRPLLCSIVSVGIGNSLTRKFVFPTKSILQLIRVCQKRPVSPVLDASTALRDGHENLYSGCWRLAPFPDRSADRHSSRNRQSSLRPSRRSYRREQTPATPFQAAEARQLRRANTHRPLWTIRFQAGIPS